MSSKKVSMICLIMTLSSVILLPISLFVLGLGIIYLLKEIVVILYIGICLSVLTFSINIFSFIMSVIILVKKDVDKQSKSISKACVIIYVCYFAFCIFSFVSHLLFSGSWF